MGKKKSLSPTKRARIVTLFKDAKLSKCAIARRENVGEATVYDTIKRYEATGSYRDAHRSGRPKKLSNRDISKY